MELTLQSLFCDYVVISIIQWADMIYERAGKSWPIGHTGYVKGTLFALKLLTPEKYLFDILLLHGILFSIE